MIERNKRARLEFFSRSHALAWERLGDAPASRNPQKRDAGASRIGSHAGAWEPEKNTPLLPPKIGCKGKLELIYDYLLGFLSSIQPTCLTFDSIDLKDYYVCFQVVQVSQQIQRFLI